jgi:hypothetical protein
VLIGARENCNKVVQGKVIQSLIMHWYISYVLCAPFYLHFVWNLKTLRKKYTKINQLRNLSAALWDEDSFIISLDHEHYTNQFEVNLLLSSISV